MHKCKPDSVTTSLIPISPNNDLVLKGIAETASALQGVPRAIDTLSRTIDSVEMASIEIAGNTGAILSLLQSDKHREVTISMMRTLILEYSSISNSAKKEEEEPLLAAASLFLARERLFCDWFDISLFSSVSFEEMQKSRELIEDADSTLSAIVSGLNETDRDSYNIFTTSVKELGRLSDEYNEIIDSFDEEFIKAEPELMSKHFMYVEDDHQWHGKLPVLVFDVKGLSKFEGRIGMGDMEGDNWELKGDHLSPLETLSLSSYAFVYDERIKKMVNAARYIDGSPYGRSEAMMLMLQEISILDLSKKEGIREIAQSKIDELKEKQNQKKGFFSKLVDYTNYEGEIEFLENWISEIDKTYSTFDEVMNKVEEAKSEISYLVDKSNNSLPEALHISHN
jgi:hypothetical protein